MISWIEIIGFIAAFFTTIAGLPQLIKVIKTRKARDLSIAMILILSLGIFLWLIYGILINSWPLIIADTISLAIALAILFFKLKYK